MVTDADLYRRSSQYQKWSFTKDQLAELLAKPNRNVPPHELALTVQEEQQLILYYAAEQVKSVCQQFKLPSQVRATAISFFRKFYMRYSVMEYHPKLILPTCVFFAAKAENAFMSITTFCDSLAKTEPSQILDLEFLLFKTLEFTATVHNGLRPLHGFFLDMQTVLDTFDRTELCSIHDKAKSLIVDSFVSDVCFLYTPTQIALAALMEVNELAATQYMAQSMDGPNTSLDRLLTLIHGCRQQLVVNLPSQEEVKGISKKLSRYYKDTGSEGPATKKQRTN
ncbi:Cyclin CCL1 [Wickerhamiella sorbophila]|uniref:Cyclin CCL1 n=1 Tax=Wickerhamiella sorbophila TaxID=45607 RepID=A0A2T0FK88_9ASCO|nr:Cyclin CCL1 [Wickerhamiella sorbophila]PRT55400.1 Cyclin CCL1 [Wickerhamiella sorbophila]